MIQPGSHSFGPDNAALTVKTGRTGAAATVGHDLLILVTAWQATFELGADAEQSRIDLTADPSSLRVSRGRGGLRPLGNDDKAKIEKTIDADVLKRRAIEFRSTAVQAAGDRGGLHVQGSLTIGSKTRPVAFELGVDAQDRLSGAVVLKQSDWGIKPYTTLFGALKVLDAVELALHGGPAPD